MLINSKSSIVFPKQIETIIFTLHFMNMILGHLYLFLLRLIPKKKVIFGLHFDHLMFFFYGLHFDHFDAIMFETFGRTIIIALPLYQLIIDFDFEKCLTKYY